MKMSTIWTAYNVKKQNWISLMLMFTNFIYQKFFDLPYKIDVLRRKRQIRKTDLLACIANTLNCLKYLRHSSRPCTLSSTGCFSQVPKYSKTKKNKKIDSVFGNYFEIECHILDTGRSQAKSMHEKSIFLLTMFWVPCYHIYLLYVMVVADFKVKKTHFLPIPLKSRICVPNT